MILVSLALLASSILAVADEETAKPVEEIQFGERMEVASGAGVDPRLFRCYKGLTENEFPRSHPKRIILRGEHGEQPGFISYFLGKPTLFAPLPDGALDWNRKPVKLLDRDSKPLFALVTKGELSMLPDKQSLSGIETLRFTAIFDEKIASSRLTASTEDRIQRLHARFRARPKGSSPGLYLEKLETCRKFPDPALRTLIDEEIQKFARPR